MNRKTPMIFLSVTGKILKILLYLAFQQNAALGCHLITQVLNEMWTWNEHGNEHFMERKLVNQTI